MRLDVSTWKPFVTSQLFPVMENGKANQQMLDDGDECFYVGAKRDDNGVMLHCQRDESLITKGNCIVFICNGQGSVGFANYMDVDFIGTTDIVAGYNDHLNEYTGAFLATVYSQERPKYSFGRKWKTHLRDTEVKLPADEDGNPDWQFMEDYIKSFHHKPLTTKNKVRTIQDLNVESWKEFEISSLFTAIKGRTLTSEDKDEYKGDIACINVSAENNGLHCKLNTAAGIILPLIKAPALSLSRVGNSGMTFLQTEDFYIADNAYSLKLLDSPSGDINAIYIFLSTVLNLELYKYSYGRIINTKYFSTLIKLPVDADGNPDWQFMENYIKSLPYGDRLAEVM